MIIRPETPKDAQAIFDLTTVAFAPMTFSDDTEPQIINDMRAAGELLLSLVAEEDGEIIGHVAFSPASMECAGRWLGLGPISVAPMRQKKGIGSSMVRAGLDQLRGQGFDGCVLLGNPKVYGPMGFKSGGITYRDLPSEIVQWQAFGTMEPTGEIKFVPALEET